MCGLGKRTVFHHFIHQAPTYNSFIMRLGILPLYFFFFYWGLEELLCSCLSLTTWKHVKKAVCTQQQEASGKSAHQISETAPASSQLYNPIPPPQKKKSKQINKKKQYQAPHYNKKFCLETRTLLSANPLLSDVF